MTSPHLAPLVGTLTKLGHSPYRIEPVSALHDRASGSSMVGSFQDSAGETEGKPTFPNGLEPTQ